MAPAQARPVLARPAGRAQAEAPPIQDLCADLLAETSELGGWLDSMAAGDLDVPTPAVGWTVRDQITHLAYFDEAAARAITDPASFPGDVDIQVLVDRVTDDNRDCRPDDLRSWFHRARTGFLAAAWGSERGVRVPWYGVEMSVGSMVTARIMETWAHAQDVADALALPRAPTSRLRHIAFLGVRALPNSYRSHGLPVPAAAVRVELRAPDGQIWRYGPDSATDVVQGPALDFCLVVTQRRHPEDTALSATGATALQWLSIAQAFAGPPGCGRHAGQFPHG